jgi:chromosome partitioning protein
MDEDPENAIQTTELPLLWVLPADKNLAGAEIELVSRDRREFRLREILSPLKEKYDFILIDCPPSLGLLTINGLTAADSLLVPIQCEYYALEGVTELFDTFARLRDYY